MKYIIFGGSFDPPHIGHLNKAEHARKMVGAEGIVFMPAYQHPWGKKLTYWIDRFTMLEYSIDDLNMKNCFISAFEVRCPNLATYEILLQFFKDEDYNINDSAYLIGSDQAVMFHKWEHWEDLLKLLPFIVITRDEKDIIPDFFYKPPHVIIEDKISTISSTKIRNLLLQGIEPINLITTNTLKYIKENELYVK